MNREALEQLERVVTDAPDELFVMNTFSAPMPCGTVRCAAGWASVDPWFQANCPIPRPWEGYTYAFGITKEDADVLFGAELDARWWDLRDPSKAKPRRDVTKLEVVANIRRLLRGEHPRPYRAVLAHEAER